MNNISRTLVVLAALVLAARPLHADGARITATSEAQPLTAQQRSPSKALPVTLVIVGGVAIVGGSVAIAIDQDEYAAPAGQNQRQFYTDSAEPGFVALASGAVLVTAGVYLLWSRRQATSTPTVDARAGGAVIGFAHRW